MENTQTYECEVNDANDRLLFDFITNKIPDEKKQEIEALISSDVFWSEYYLDIKWLYATYGSIGLEMSKKEPLGEIPVIYNEICKNTLESFYFKLKKINVYFMETPLISKGDLRSIYKDLDEIGKDLNEFTELAIAQNKAEYTQICRLLMTNLDEFNLRVSDLEKVKHKKLNSRKQSLTSSVLHKT